MCHLNRFKIKISVDNKIVCIRDHASEQEALHSILNSFDNRVDARKQLSNAYQNGFSICVSSNKKYSCKIAKVHGILNFYHIFEKERSLYGFHKKDKSTSFNFLASSGVC